MSQNILAQVTVVLLTSIICTAKRSCMAFMTSGNCIDMNQSGRNIELSNVYGILELGLVSSSCHLPSMKAKLTNAEVITLILILLDATNLSKTRHAILSGTYQLLRRCIHVSADTSHFVKASTLRLLGEQSFCGTRSSALAIGPRVAICKTSGKHLSHKTVGAQDVVVSKAW